MSVFFIVTKSNQCENISKKVLYPFYRVYFFIVIVLSNVNKTYLFKPLMLRTKVSNKYNYKPKNIFVSNLPHR